MGLSNKRPHSLNYGVNKKGPKGGKKVQNALKHFDTLLKREKVEGKTKWLSNAMEFAMAKLKKYSVNPNKK